MNQNHQVLYLSYDGMTDPLGQSQVLPYLCGLSRLGYCFRLISFEKQDRFELYQQKIRSICEQNGIEWIPLTYTKSPPLLSTLYDVWRLGRVVKSLHRKIPIDMIHCRSYLTALVGRKMQRRMGIPFLFDMRGFWADERIEGGIWSMKNPVFRLVYRFFKNREKVLLRDADHVISLTNRAKEEIEKWNDWKGKIPDITVIPCCVDLDRFSPNRVSADEKKRLISDLEIPPSAFILGYIGSIGTWYMLPEMLGYFKILKERIPESIFLLVTQHDRQELGNIANENGIDTADLRVVSCSHDEVPKYISIMNRSIFFIRPSFSKMASSPTKQGEIMAMGVPLVCNAGVGDTDRIVKEYHAGTVLSELSETCMFESLIHLEAFDRIETIRGAQEYFSLQKGVAKYQLVYQQIIRSS